MSDTIERPEVVEDQHLEYLEGLKASSEMNMMHGRSMLVNEYGLSRPDAMKVFIYWMKTCGQESG